MVVDADAGELLVSGEQTASNARMSAVPGHGKHGVDSWCCRQRPADVLSKTSRCGGEFEDRHVSEDAELLPSLGSRGVTRVSPVQTLGGRGISPAPPSHPDCKFRCGPQRQLGRQTCSAAGGQTVHDIKVVSMSELDPVGLENVVVRLNFKSNVIDFSNRPPGQSIRPN